MNGNFAKYDMFLSLGPGSTFLPRHTVVLTISSIIAVVNQGYNLANP